MFLFVDDVSVDSIFIDFELIIGEIVVVVVGLFFVEFLLIDLGGEVFVGVVGGIGVVGVFGVASVLRILCLFALLLSML